MTIKAVEEAVHQVRQWMVGDNYWHILDRNEAAVRYILIDPILRALDWEIDNPELCVVEYKQDGQSGPADYVLFDTDVNHAVIIETKNTGNRNLNALRDNPEKLEEQLARYVGSKGNKVGVLTNGLIWRLYDLDNRSRRLENQRVEPIIDVYQNNKITNRQIREGASILYKYLNAGRFGW